MKNLCDYYHKKLINRQTLIQFMIDILNIYADTLTKSKT